MISRYDKLNLSELNQINSNDIASGQALWQALPLVLVPRPDRLISEHDAEGRGRGQHWNFEEAQASRLRLRLPGSGDSCAY